MVANKERDPNHESAGAWAKKYYFASRAVLESILRPYDLGPTQWYVLYRLANAGPTKQRDLVRMLNVERATLSGVVAALVRKGLVEQIPEPNDQRQRLLRITGAGAELWDTLPDPIGLIMSVAFDGVDEADLATTARVLKLGAHRLTTHLSEGAEQ
ncbi:MarR family winged helix-turn-helix transcriptional regulator [Streptomyces sp. NPDC001255]|uniref:MarR family winged helix-turn-helix transcriptional regulator n=1 Tax=Streptomyces sp. NPDC001255 TaxID=3364550 RepID=UPI0036948783